MSTKEDLRVQKTKAALAVAFLKLLEDKPLDEITINDLCDEAGVRRATFYKHYTDKFDFLCAYAGGLRDKFDKSIWKSPSPANTVEYYVEYSKRAIKFISENEKAVNNLLKSSLALSALSIIVEQNYKDTCKHLAKSVEAGLELNASIDVTAGLCSGGIFTVIYAWLYGDRQTSPEELAEQVGAIIAAAITKK